MHDELRPASDLVADGIGGTLAGQRERAALTVAAAARDAQDCALLLDVLGLHSPKPSAEPRSA